MLLSLAKLLFEKKNATPVPPRVEERLDDLERQVHSLKLEWLETSDKVERWMHRSIKRAAIEPHEPPPPPPAPEGYAPGPDPVSARILARRRGVRHARVGGAPPEGEGSQ